MKWEGEDQSGNVEDRRGQGGGGGGGPRLGGRSIGLGAIAVAFVSPDSFTVFLSITFLVGVVIGGLASIPGAIFGAMFIQFVPNIADEISKSAPWAIYGVFLIAFMYLMPMGVMGMLRKLGYRWSNRGHGRDNPVNVAPGPTVLAPQPQGDRPS